MVAEAAEAAEAAEDNCTVTLKCSTEIFSRRFGRKILICVEGLQPLSVND